MARQDSNTVQDFTRLEKVDGVLTLVVVATAVATTKGASHDTGDAPLTEEELCSLLGADPSSKLAVCYTDHFGTPRCWRGSVWAAHAQLGKAHREGTWGAGLKVGIAQLLDADTDMDIPVHFEAPEDTELLDFFEVACRRGLACRAGYPEDRNTDSKSYRFIAVARDGQKRGTFLPQTIRG
jgi:hypothetical protein